jgi:tripartite-type tricarboxylate transporter receptor subunit TctC
VVSKIKADPGNVSCAMTGGVGSIGCEMLEAMTRTKLLKVAYTGSNPGTLAVIQGDVDLAFNFSITAQTGAQADQARPVATTAPKRGGPPFPQLPAMNEVMPGFELAGWHGVMVPNGTPRDIVTRLNQDINAVLKMPDIKEKLEKGGLEPIGGTPEDFAARLGRVRTTFGKVFAENGIKPQ